MSVVAADVVVGTAANNIIEADPEGIFMDGDLLLGIIMMIDVVEEVGEMIAEEEVGGAMNEEATIAEVAAVEGVVIIGKVRPVAAGPLAALMIEIPTDAMDHHHHEGLEAEERERRRRMITAAPYPAEATRARRQALGATPPRRTDRGQGRVPRGQGVTRRDLRGVGAILDQVRAVTPGRHQGNQTSESVVAVMAAVVEGEDDPVPTLLLLPQWMRPRRISVPSLSPSW